MFGFVFCILSSSPPSGPRPFSTALPISRINPFSHLTRLLCYTISAASSDSPPSIPNIHSAAAYSTYSHNTILLPHATIPTKPQHYTPSSLSHQAPETEREANPSLLRQQLTETTSPNHPTHAPRKKAGPIPQPTSLIPCIYLCVVSTPRLKSRRVQRRR